MNKNRAIFLFVFVLIFMGAFGFFLKKEEGVQKSVTNENMEPSSEQLERNEDVVIKQENKKQKNQKLFPKKRQKFL